jgi:catechol 2,3-dioxygenase-like lactoylglutathione lyase family enzyme
METTATGMTQVSPTTQPRFSGMSHVSLPCRNLEEAKLFYSEVMGGEWVHEIAGFVEYRIADIIIGLSEQHDGWTGRRDRTALIYFRDPSGNLFELYCRKLKEASTFARGAKQGGSYALDFAALNYQWKG